MIGLGVQGGRLIESVHRKSRELAITMGVTIDPTEAAVVRDKYGIPVHDRLGVALEDPDIDGVVLATPPMIHAEQTRAAARAGKHVLCEKPFTLALPAAVEAAAACRDAGVVLGVAFTHRLHPAMQELSRLVRNGELGTILHAEGNYSHDWGASYDPKSWKALPEASPAKTRFFTGNGVHTLDALIGLFGEVSSVYARGTRRAVPLDLLDVVVVHLDFADGMTATVTSLDGTPFIWRLQVYGTEGWAEVRDFHALSLHRGGKMVTMTYPQVSVLRAGLEAFAAAIRGIVPYSVSVTEALQGVAAYEGVIASLRSGDRLSVASPTAVH